MKTVIDQLWDETARLNEQLDKLSLVVSKISDSVRDLEEVVKPSDKISKKSKDIGRAMSEHLEGNFGDEEWKND